MDLATIGGFLVAMVTIVVGAALEHVTLGSMLGPSAFLIVVGGSAGAGIISHTMEELKTVPQALKLAISPPKQDYIGMIDELCRLADKARKMGLLALQEDVEKSPNPLVRQGLMMTVDGADVDAVSEMLESMSHMDGERLKRGAAVFATLGGFAPTLGILGTVMGLVTIMGNLSNPDSLGPAIAVAFLATLYGVGVANLIYLPLGSKIKAAVNQKSHFDQMVMVGIIGLQTGENPRMLRDKLMVYTMGHVKPAASKAQEGA